MQKTTKNFLIIILSLAFYCILFSIIMIEKIMFMSIEYITDVWIVLYVLSIWGIFFYKKHIFFLFIPLGVFILLYWAFNIIANMRWESCYNYWESRTACECIWIEKSDWGWVSCVWGSWSCSDPWIYGTKEFTCSEFSDLKRQERNK